MRRRNSHLQFVSSAASRLVGLLVVTMMVAVAGPQNAHAGFFGFGGPADKWVGLPNGDRMHYTESGSSSGKTLLFVHGFPTSARLYEPLMEQICDGRRSPYRCIAVSHIGFGKSSCPGDGRLVDAPYLADRLEEFIVELDLTDTAVVVHDWGGPTGVAAALRRSDRVSHLVFLNTFLDFNLDNNPLILALNEFVGDFFQRDRLVLELFPSFVSFVMEEFTTRRLGIWTRRDYTVPYRSFFEGRCRAQAGIELFARAGDAPTAALFDEIAEGLSTDWAGRPARFLWATEDILLGPGTGLGQSAHGYMSALVPQAETVLIPDADHYMQEDQPRLIAQEIMQFVPSAQ